eukprot:gene18945-25514_t
MENKVSRSNKAMVQEKHSLQAPHVAAVDGSRDAFSDDAKLLSIFPDFSSSLKERGVYEEPNSPTSAQVGLFSHMDINTFDSSSLSPRGSHSSVASEMTDIIRVYTSHVTSKLPRLLVNGGIVDETCTTKLYEADETSNRCSETCTTKLYEADETSNRYSETCTTKLYEADKTPNSCSETCTTKLYEADETSDYCSETCTTKLY